MTSSREQILARLRQADRPFPDTPAPDQYLPVVPLSATDPEALTARFVSEAEKLAAIVHRVDTESATWETLLGLLRGETAVSCWDDAQLPVPLADRLASAAISVAAPDDPEVRVGISGATAALAATGSLVLASGPGRFRASSLLPPVHIALVEEEQILADLESWLARQRATGLDALRQSSNITLVSGPSRTADIALELVMGMHGPRELHIILLSPAQGNKGV